MLKCGLEMKFRTPPTVAALIGVWENQVSSFIQNQFEKNVITTSVDYVLTGRASRRYGR